MLNLTGLGLSLLLASSQPAPIRPATACPQDLEVLAGLLVRDLPVYTNRVLQRSVADLSKDYRPAYVIAASLPETAPLDILDQVYTTDPAAAAQTRQLFFTTLARQYDGLEATLVRHFHWLFLAPDADGWYLAFMFSQIEVPGEPMMPPRDSTRGSVGQGVATWLRDCRAGAVAPRQ